ncbi:MAG: hypothetical protein AAF404_13100 [Pseudomonadota bacterium]
MPFVALLITLLASPVVIAETALQSEVTYSDLSVIDRQIATERYGLDDKEWQWALYLKAVDRPFGQNLSPIELLGKYAETDEERERYARIYTAVTIDQMRRSQAWALAIQKVAQERDLTREVLASTPQIKAGLERLGIRPPITDATRALYQRRQTLKQSATTLFVSLDCDKPCGELAGKLSRQVMAGFRDKLDVVFIGSDGEDQHDIFDWANAQQLSSEMLRNGAIELHLDSQHWRAFRTTDEVPQVVEP